MGALTRLYAADIGRAAVDAFKAGNDLLIIPADLDASYQAMLKAVNSGEVSPAANRRLRTQDIESKGFDRTPQSPLNDLDQLSTVVGKPENIAEGQDAADEAITLVRDNGKTSPPKKSRNSHPADFRIPG